MGRTLFDKIWDSHVVADLGSGFVLLHIDRLLLHDLSMCSSTSRLPRSATTWLSQILSNRVLPIDRSLPLAAITAPNGVAD